MENAKYHHTNEYMQKYAQELAKVEKRLQQQRTGERKTITVMAHYTNVYMQKVALELEKIEKLLHYQQTEDIKWIMQSKITQIRI